MEERENVKKGQYAIVESYLDMENNHSIYLKKEPDTCPICHAKIKSIPNLIYSNIKNNNLQIVARCPNRSCDSLFINYYTCYNMTKYSKSYNFRYSKPIKLEEITFKNSINEISENFVSIYNEANKAEQYQLLNIYGPGYRKALEFLIKDYLIYKGNNEEIIKKKFLGNCIKEDIDDIRIKEIAERATWIGNDEVHYNRKWLDKDVNDLKILIEMITSHIQVELDHEKMMQDMPEDKK